MIISRTPHGVQMMMSQADAARLASLVAGYKGADGDQQLLRQEILTRLSLHLAGDARWYLKFPHAVENAPGEHQMGIIKLIQQANGLPAIRAEFQALLKAFAGRLSALVESTQPRAATPAQKAMGKEASW